MSVETEPLTYDTGIPSCRGGYLPIIKVVNISKLSRKIPQPVLQLRYAKEGGRLVVQLAYVVSRKPLQIGRSATLEVRQVNGTLPDNHIFRCFALRLEISFPQLVRTILTRVPEKVDEPAHVKAASQQ